ncbi:MAG: type II toxin-antitoxin system PemK/MazF family toxin [Isosphaeraceae bacterium]|jgi:mRNA interferase MazF
MIMPEEQVPRRGEVYWIDLADATGQATSKVRPCVVIQNDCDNRERAVTIVAAITSISTMESLPYAVRLKRGVAGLSGQPFVNCGHIYTVSKRHLQRRSGHLSSNEMCEVEKAIMYSLGISAAERDQV